MFLLPGGIIPEAIESNAAAEQARQRLGRLDNNQPTENLNGKQKIGRFARWFAVIAGVTAFSDLGQSRFKKGETELSIIGSEYPARLRVEYPEGEVDNFQIEGNVHETGIFPVLHGDVIVGALDIISNSDKQLSPSFFPLSENEERDFRLFQSDNPGASFADWFSLGKPRGGDNVNLLDGTVGGGVSDTDIKFVASKSNKNPGTFGHTFSTHGEKLGKDIPGLANRARQLNVDAVGAFTSNKKAAELLGEIHSKIGVPAETLVIKTNKANDISVIVNQSGEILDASGLLLVKPSPTNKFIKDAFPIDAGKLAQEIQKGTKLIDFDNL